MVVSSILQFGLGRLSDNWTVIFTIWKSTPQRIPHRISESTLHDCRSSPALKCPSATRFQSRLYRGRCHSPGTRHPCIFHQRSVHSVSVDSSIVHNFYLVALIDLGYSSHAFHSSNRLVFMTAKLGTKSGRAQKMVIRTPPNNRVFPPGPGTNRVYHPRIVSHSQKLTNQLMYIWLLTMSLVLVFESW